MTSNIGRCTILTTVGTKMAQRGFSRFLISELRVCRRDRHRYRNHQWRSTCTGIAMLNAEKSHSSPIPVMNLASVKLFATQTQQPQTQLETPTPNIDQQYEECIRDLNTLQSNAVTIRRSISLNGKQLPLSDMLHFIKLSGIDLNELEKIPFIHVSGTKGKGSTCALTESILRAHGVRTAFFSSPHLVSITERIRINGKPISKQKFVHSFRRLFDRLKKLQKYDGNMPAYFKFLTIAFFQICLEEKVDVIILEVGIGGELDCTNIIRNTETVGITSLGLEHTQLLGNTLPEIAWQKAGIIKINSDVYTSVTQPECLEVIQKRAKENHATLHIVPAFKNYLQDPETSKRLHGLNEIVQLNGSLAIQLAYNWLRKHGFLIYKKIADTMLTREVEDGLLNCEWPGRCQVIKLQNLNIHVDGAHTMESIAICSKWFKQVTSSSSKPRVLIFNMTGDRYSAKLLEILSSYNEFTFACFTPNIAFGSANHKDNTSVYGLDEQLNRAHLHSQEWAHLAGKPKAANAFVFTTVHESLQHIQQMYGTSKEVDVLVTGSLHLVGALMTVVNELTNKLALNSSV